ncbi:MAG: hypothetical protein EA399_17945 [Desulfovibrionales bacterium]|nr:MAG: hypothetical protein EA399_17945 [Desulfovibrionales bacterium]
MFVGEVFDGVKHLLASKNERRFTPVGGVERVCCFNRPYDAQTQLRIRLETVKWKIFFSIAQCSVLSNTGINKARMYMQPWDKQMLAAT